MDFKVQVLPKITIMKYFTICLPQKGELKERDKIAWDNINNLAVSITGTKNCIKTLKNDGYQRAKLFLCSKDIQPGDICWTTVGNCYDTFRTGYDKKYWFKIVAEVSSEATWVKSGDKFNEKDVKFLATDLNLFIVLFEEDKFENAITHPYYQAHKNSTKLVAIIKNHSCNHFH